MHPFDRQRQRARHLGTDEEQVANANPDFIDLTPTSDEPAEGVRQDWAAVKKNEDD